MYVNEGQSLISMYSMYAYNEAKHVGGGIMVENMDKVLIQFDSFLNGSALLSGLSLSHALLYGVTRRMHLWLQCA